MRLFKPTNGWRAFWGEIAIIVIGVLIALGAQQFVQGVSDRQRADDAMAAIRSEVAYHDFIAAEFEITAPCIAAQAEAIEKRLVAGDTRLLTRYTDRSKKLGFVLRLPQRVWEDTAWNSIRDTDVLRELEPQFAERVAVHYAQIASQADSGREALQEVSRLNALALMMPRGEAERLRSIQAAELIRSNVDRLDLVAGQIRDRLANVDLLASNAVLQRNLADSGTIKFCRANGYPLGKLRPVDPNSADI